MTGGGFLNRLACRLFGHKPIVKGLHGRFYCASCGKRVVG